MTEAIAFDTHRFVKRLTGCGFTEQQAEVLADEQVALLNANLATKVDLAEVKAAVQKDIAAIQRDIVAFKAAVQKDIAAFKAAVQKDIAAVKTDVATVKAELLKWMIGALIAQGGVVVALVKLL